MPDVEFAAFAGDLEGLTPLIIALLMFVTALIFHKQIKLVSSRLGKVNFKRGNTQVEADLTQSHDEQAMETLPRSRASDPDGGQPSEETEVIAASGPDGDAPNVSAIRSDMMTAFMAGDKAAGDAKYAQLQTHEKDPVERKMDQARRLSTMIIGGVDSNGFAALDKLTKDAEITSFCLRMKGIALSAVEKPVEAADAFLESARTAETPMGRATGVALRAEALTKLGKADEAEAELTKDLRDAEGDEITAKYWSGLADVYRRTDRTELLALALHNVAKAEGNNAQAWFKAGYAYSEVAPSDHLAIPTVHCYLNALYFDKKQEWAMNNLGVVLNEHGMPILAVDRYEKAVELGNTLASANLADKLMRAGFQKDAERLVDEAAKAGNVHENVAVAKAAIDASRKEQQKKYDQMATAGTRVGQFLSNYARRRFDATPTIADSWKLKKFDVAVIVDSERIEATWEESSYRGHCRFKGVVAGATLFGDFEKESSYSLGGNVSWEKDGAGYGYFDPAGGVLNFLKLKEDNADYLELNLTAPAGPG